MSSPKKYKKPQSCHNLNLTSKKRFKTLNKSENSKTSLIPKDTKSNSTKKKSEDSMKWATESQSPQPWPKKSTITTVTSTFNSKKSTKTPPKTSTSANLKTSPLKSALMWWYPALKAATPTCERRKNPWQRRHQSLNSDQKSRSIRRKSRANWANHY